MSYLFQINQLQPTDCPTSGQQWLYILSFIVGVGLPYWLIVSITGSTTTATYVLGFSVLLIAPMFFVNFYWAYRFEFKPFTMTSEESKALSRSSTLVAISALFLIWGTLIFQNGWRFTGAVPVAIYAVLTVLQLRLAWQSKRRTHERLLEESGFGAASSSFTLAQRRNLFPIIVIGVVNQVFVWGGIYLIYQGSVFLGILATAIGALLCLPLVRKLCQTVESTANVT